MRRPRLFLMPLIVTTVGVAVWAASRPKEAEKLIVNPERSVSKEEIDVPKEETLDEILKRDPIRFFPMSLEKYDKTIQGYACTFDKQERIAGKLRNPEQVEVRFREKPFSVHMSWNKGGGLASKVLYNKEDNPDKLLARAIGPLALLGLQTRDVAGADAKANGRFTIAQFGFKQSTERTYAKAKAAQERGKLFLKFEGIVPVGKLNGERCLKFVRTPMDPPEEDELNHLTVYYDLKNWLQVGAVLIDKKGDLLAEYWFTDIVINPVFSDKQFTKDAL